MFSFVNQELDFAHKYDEKPRHGAEFERHYHDIFELYYFVRGNAYFTVEDAIYDLHPGDIVFIQPGEHHFVSFHADSEYERYVLKFQENLLPRYMFSRLQSRATFYFANEYMSSLFFGLDDIYEKYDEDSCSTIMKCRLLEIMALLCLEKGIEKPHKSDVTITQLINYIGEKLYDPITLQDICKHFHFSQSYISSKFTKFMKVSVISYARTKKIMAAHRDICSGESPTGIAEKYGFSDYSSFYRAYKKIIGTAPSQHA